MEHMKSILTLVIPMCVWTYKCESHSV